MYSSVKKSLEFWGGGPANASTYAPIHLEGAMDWADAWRGMSQEG